MKFFSMPFERNEFDYNGGFAVVFQQVKKSSTDDCALGKGPMILHEMPRVTQHYAHLRF